MKNESRKIILCKMDNNKRSRTAIFSVNVAGKKLVEQTTNHFYKQTDIDRKQLGGHLVEKNQAD